MSTLSVKEIRDVQIFDNTVIDAAYDVANGGYSVANVAFNFANGVSTNTTAAFAKANAALANASGTFAGTLSTSGGISVTGNMASISPSSIGVYLGRDPGAANNAGIDISCSPTGYGWLDFNNSSGIDYKGRIGYDIGNDIMHLVTNGTIRQQIDSAGRVTKPFQPAWSATANYGASYNAPGGALTPIIFGSTDVNVGNHYNTSTGLFTAPVAGNYWFSAQCHFSAATGYTSIQVRKNGSFVITNSWCSAPGTYNPATMGVCIGIVYLAANDTLRVDLYTNRTDNYITETYWKFAGHLVG